MERGQTDDTPVEEEDLEGVWELDPNDPSHPDYDLSNAAGYANWEPSHKPVLARNGVILIVAVLVIVAIIFSILPRI